MNPLSICVFCIHVGNKNELEVSETIKQVQNYMLDACDPQTFLLVLSEAFY